MREHRIRLSSLRNITQKQIDAPNGTESPVSIPLGVSAEREFERMRSLADCVLKLTLDEGSEASLPSHKALLAKDSQIIW